MVERVIAVGDGFWNIRGEFKLGGILNIGTHASLLQRKNGKFLLLDAYTLNDSLLTEVQGLTNGGKDVEAIINLHPFHTVHVERSHQQFPGAKLYGTQRHLERFPNLPWQPEKTESAACAALFADDLAFSVPAGVDFISSNENLHFSSVLAYHPASRTIHADDTLMYIPLPGLLAKLKKPEVSFHMTLAATLEKRPGAAKDFRHWARDLASQWVDAENLCAAHSAAFVPAKNQAAPSHSSPFAAPQAAPKAASISERILLALDKVEKTLSKHEKKFG